MNEPSVRSILTYLCEAARPERLARSREHAGAGLLTLAELATAPTPSGYLRSIEVAVHGAHESRNE